MKPNVRTFRRCLVSTLVVVPASFNLAQADTISNLSGNVTVTSADNGANTVLADGSFAGPPYTVTIESDVILTGDAIEMNGINVIAGGYTIENFGSLDVDGRGIYGTVDGLTINNHENSVIQGIGGSFGSEGIYTEAGLKLSNYGDIGGFTGVDALDGADIHNYATGTISGDLNGISIFGKTGLASSITNEGTITGITGAGIFAAGGANLVTVTNSGMIFGDTAAIELQGDNNVINLEIDSYIDGDILGGDGVESLNFTVGQMDLSQDSNIVHGNVRGMDTITKSGSGFAFIGQTGDAYDVEADEIQIDSGGLFINGDVDGLGGGGSQVTLDSGELGGMDNGAGWNADIELLNGGGIGAGSTPLILATNPEETVGTLRINGNVIHDPASGSYVRVNIVPQTVINLGINSDLIVNSGTYDLGNADIRITPTHGGQVLNDGIYTIIDSNRSISGFDGLLTSVNVQLDENASVINDSVLTEYFSTVSLTDADTNLVLEITHAYAALPGLTANQIVLASVLDDSLDNPDPSVQQFIASLDYSDLGTVQRTLAMLDPSTTFGITSTVVSSNYRLHRLTQQHLAAVRNRETVVETSPSTIDSKGAMAAGPETIQSAGHGHAWGSLSYAWQNYDASANSADYDGGNGSFTAGFDWRVAPRLVFGVVLDGSKGDYDGDGFSSDVDSFRAAVYGTWGASMGLYSDFLVGYGNHRLDSTRRFPIGGSASSDTDSTSLQAMWSVGYTMGDAQVKHGPFAGLEHQNVDVDGFTESGPLPSLPMKVDGYAMDSFRALIGYRVDANFGTFRPYGSIAYAHEFEDDGTSTTATFGTVPFRISGARQSSAFLITLGAGIILTDNLMLDIGYHGEVATDDGMTSHGGSIAVDYSF